ncbi:hypothetical protein DW714_01425 [Streptococcus anginosus]|nr:hypothetical protein DW714_01425 [Streptococcus anginosus]RIB37135.1 hypothetical protein D1J72_04015 [Streptococcus anginosus]
MLQALPFLLLDNVYYLSLKKQWKTNSFKNFGFFPISSLIKLIWQNGFSQRAAVLVIHWHINDNRSIFL